MLELTKRLLEAAEGGGAVILASVLEPGGLAIVSGTRMLVEADGRVLGTLGHTGLDEAVRAHAPAAFAAHGAETRYYDGGTLGARTIAGAAAVYLEVVESRPVFLIVGAGHIGRSLAKVAHLLEFHVAVIDDREEYADPALLPDADEVICEDFEAALDAYPIDANTAIVMVTRGHKQDEISLRHSLGRGAGYIGMIGSKRRTATVLAHLAEEGFDPAELRRLRTPIGLDIGAETPEEIAISIAAEVILVRRGGTGAAMYYRRAAVNPRD